VRKAARLWLVLWVTLVCALAPMGLFAQAQQAVVIQGGTLIDGNGGAPVPDAVIVIQGNRISAVGRRGQVNVPAGAQVIDATGKFVIPGLWDAQVSYQWYFGEVMLNNGITATVDVGNSGEIAIPHRDAILHGKSRGPRPFTSISRFTANPGGTGLESILTPDKAPKSATEALSLARTFLAAGADYVMFTDGAMPLDYYKTIFDEAHRQGKAVNARPYGPILGPKEAAELGANNLSHSAGLADALMKNPLIYEPSRAGRNEADMWSEMDDARAKEMIQILVQHNVALTPTFRARLAPYPKDWALFAEQDRRFFDDADSSLLAYYPRDRIVTALAGYRATPPTGAVAERRRRGYLNALRFHKMFVDAGGHLIPGANTNAGRVPGNSFFQEVAIFTEAGVTPMQIIQGATKWSAEMMAKDKDLGTVEAGKIADIVILDQNPLQNIANLRSTNAVIFDGKPIEMGYHASFSDPFPRLTDYNPPVSDLVWVSALRETTAGRGGGRGGGQAMPPDPAEAPQPGIETILPVMVTEGSPTITLTIKGVNFVRRSQVLFKGAPVPYQAVNANELAVTLDANLLKEVGWHEIVVRNPWPYNRDSGRPWGNGTSNPAHLIINYKY
jgi:imidazolonepropionase-like amidohydrolase